MITEDNREIIPNLGEFEALLQTILTKDVEPKVEDFSMDWAYLQMLATGYTIYLNKN